MRNKRDRAREMAEEGLDMIVEGEERVGRKLIDLAREIDPKAIEELAAKIERDKEILARFVERKIGRRIDDP